MVWWESRMGNRLLIGAEKELRRSPQGWATEPSRPRQSQQPRDHRRGPPLGLEGLDLEVLGSSSEVTKARDGQRRNRERRDKKPGHGEKPWRPPLDTEEDEDVSRGHSGSREYRERKAGGQEGTRTSAPLILDGEGDHAVRGHRGRNERQPRSRERPPRSPPRLLDWEAEERGRRRQEHREGRSPGWEKSLRPPGLAADTEDRILERSGRQSHSPSSAYHGLSREGPLSPRAPRNPQFQDTEEPHPRRDHRRDVEREGERADRRARTSPSSTHRECWEMDRGHYQIPVTKSKGTKETAYHKPRVAAQDVELYDAEMARKMQEEELLASHVDKRAAQVAQDEEIARLLMAEEKAAYRKAKEREKSSLEKRRPDQDWKHDTHELVRPRSREGHETHRHRNDKPTRPPPPASEDLGHLANLGSKPEASHKGYHYKQ
uniref:Uncharacterized protein n=1 Tax=Sphaerodactylus townsendi TaxID=933632 RepID=A0ACB8FBE8_9SAUR